MITFDEGCHQTENGCIAISLDRVEIIFGRMVVGEGRALLILQEDAGHTAHSEGVVVAVGSQIAALDILEETQLAVDGLELTEARHTGLAELTVEGGVVVANHIYIKEVAYLREGHNGMLYEPGGTAQVGILAGEGQEVDVELWLVLCIVLGQGDEGGGARCVIVGARVEDVTPQVADMVVVGGEDVAAVVPAAQHFGDDVLGLVALQELVLHVQPYALHALNGLGRNPYDWLIHNAMAVGFEELDGRRPGIDKAGIIAYTRLLQLREGLVVTIGEPELAGHQATRILGLGQVGKHAVGVEVERIDVVNGELSHDARRVLAHREVEAGLQLASVGPHLHLAVERIDVECEGLERYLIDP